MEATAKITVLAVVKADIKAVWRLWTRPEHVIHWNQASEDWHTPRAENDLRKDGRFTYRMEAKDGSAGFDFGGTYDEVKTNERIAYTLDDGRKVEIGFTDKGQETEIVETFEAETANTVDRQRKGWQAIMDSFRDYAEGRTK